MAGLVGAALLVGCASGPKRDVLAVGSTLGVAQGLPAEATVFVALEAGAAVASNGGENPTIQRYELMERTLVLRKGHVVRGTCVCTSSQCFDTDDIVEVKVLGPAGGLTPLELAIGLPVAAAVTTACATGAESPDHLACRPPLQEPIVREALPEAYCVALEEARTTAPVEDQ